MSEILYIEAKTPKKYNPKHIPTTREKLEKKRKKSKKTDKLNIGKIVFPLFSEELEAIVKETRNKLASFKPLKIKAKDIKKYSPEKLFFSKDITFYYGLKDYIGLSDKAKKSLTEYSNQLESGNIKEIEEEMKELICKEKPSFEKILIYRNLKNYISLSSETSKNLEKYFYGIKYLGLEKTKEAMKKLIYEDLDIKISPKRSEMQDVFSNIEDVGKNFKTAFSELFKSERFRIDNNLQGMKKSVAEKIFINKVFPLMIKESFLRTDNDTWDGKYVGYFQIGKRAVEETKKYPGLPERDYDKSNHVDNCILGIVYYLQMLEKIENFKIKGDEEGFIKGDEEKFALFFYNVGEGTSGDILKIYKEEKNVTTINSFDDFASWLSGSSGKEDKKTYNKELQITFKNWFKGVELNENELFNGIIEVKKIHIGLDYVEKIIAVREKYFSQRKK